MKFLILLACVLALPGPAQARNGGAVYGQPPDRSTRNTIMLHEMQRRAYEQDQEWRRRTDEERQRELWRRDEQRRREDARPLEERMRGREQHRAHEEQRQERFRHELLERDGQKDIYRAPEYKDKPLDPRELRRYDLIRPGRRP